MNRFIILLLLTLPFKRSIAQNPDLLSRLNKANEDTAKINLLNLLSKDLFKTDLERAFKFAREAEYISLKNNYNYGLAGAFSNKGYYFLRKGELDSALTYFNKGISLTQHPDFKTLYADLLNRKGVTLYQMGRTDSSLIYLNRALSSFESLKDSAAVIKALNNIGAISLRTGDMDGAISYFFKCLSYDEKQKNNEGIAMDCNNIGIILMDKKDFNAALNYLNKAYNIKLENKDTLGILKTRINIANVYWAKKDFNEAIKQFQNALTFCKGKLQETEEYALIANNLGECLSLSGQSQKALSYFLISLQIKNKIGSQSGIAGTTGNIGNCYLLQKKYAQAADYYEQSYNLAKQTGDLELQKNAQHNLTQCYIHLKQSDKADESLRLYTQLRDSLYNENNTKQVSDIQIKYETEKKEADNKLLKQENAIATLQNQKNKQTIFLLLAGILVTVVIVFWQLSLARIKKQKRELEAERKLQQDRERISRDLHDNVGGQLSYVMFSLEAEEETTPEKRQQKANNLANALRGVTGNLRETIWALNQQSLTIQDISDKLKLYARNIFSYSNTKIKFEENISGNKLIPPTIALNIFRISQEIINNCFKHAKASEVLIKISDETGVTISIHDNGIGFKTETAVGESFGLNNLSKRANEINGELKIVSAPDKGTTVTLIV